MLKLQLQLLSRGNRLLNMQLCAVWLGKVSSYRCTCGFEGMCSTCTVLCLLLFCPTGHHLVHASLLNPVRCTCESCAL